MALDMDYFRAVQGAEGYGDEGSYRRREAADSLRLQMRTSVHYRADALRNGVAQPLLVSPTETRYKYNLSALPGDDLYPGDIISVGGEQLLVQQTRCLADSYTTGLGWVCNLELRFQTFDGKLCKRQAVLESGVYSGTIGQTEELRYLNREYNLWLPWDEDSDQLYIDKRLAVDTMYDQKGQLIVDAYRITGRSRLGKGAYGRGAHLLCLTLKSSEDRHDKDRPDLLVCDYVEPEDSDGSGDDSPALLRCDISGRKRIRLGSSRTYSPVFYGRDGSRVEGIDAAWTYTCPAGISASVEAGQLTLSAGGDDSLLGSEITITLGDKEGAYAPCSMKVEVE